MRTTNESVPRFRAMYFRKTTSGGRAYLQIVESRREGAVVRQPHPVVFAWTAAQPRASLYTTSLSRGEVLAGIAIMSEGRRRAALAETAEIMFGEEFRGRILPYSEEAATAYAEIFATRRQMGRPIETADLIVAATARAHDAAVVTRDTGGFEGCGLTLINPWEAADPRR